MSLTARSFNAVNVLVNSYFGETGVIGTRAKDGSRDVFMYVIRFDGISEVPRGENAFDEWQIEKS